MQPINDPNYPNQNFYQNPPQQGWGYPPPPTAPFFPTKKRELVFGALTAVFGILLFNSILTGGFQLGFAVFTVVCTVCSVLYLQCAGCRLKCYPAAVLLLCLGITAAFARSDDGFVKFVLFLFLVTGINLGLCLQAGQNYWAPGGIGCVLDAPRTVFLMGLGRLPEAFRGLRNASRSSGKAGKKTGAMVLGLGIALIVLCVLVPLLASADAAFEGVIELLPTFDLTELIVSVIFGSALACFLYTRAVALRHNPKTGPAGRFGGKGLPVLTVNTVLIAVAAVYLVYLFSQLAYLSGGFSGVLPEQYTRAEYARRGFFEMALLCAINLGLIALSVGLVAKKQRAPLSVRLLCLFVGTVTLFLVSTASAKMFFYIGGYGLTRLRVLTEVVTIFLGIATFLVMLWLFIPKMPYMKVVFLAALVIGAAVIWADVDTVVARYNVTAYQSGALDTIDVEYLGGLGNGAVPYLAALAGDAEHPQAAAQAVQELQKREINSAGDIREWNYVNQVAGEILKPYSK